MLDPQSTESEELLLTRGSDSQPAEVSQTSKPTGTSAFYELEKTAKRSNAEAQRIRLEAAGGAYIGKKIFEARGLSKSFGEKVILKDFSYTFARYEKKGIIGENGTGKTSFLKLLTGQLQPDSGVLEVGETVRFGHYEQGGLAFDGQQRVIDTVTQIAEVVKTPDGNTISASQLLTHFLFPPARQRDYVCKLSGGERRRLYLCTVLMRNPNFLILDEPTNDLDILTMNVLEEYLARFSGCLIVVSHDENLSKEYVDGYLRLRDGRIVEAVLPPSEAGSPISGKKARGFSYLSGTFFRSLKTDRGKLALTFLSSLVASSLIIFAASYALGAKQAAEEESRLSLSYLSLSYSVVEKKEETGLLTLSRTRRPTAEERGRLLLEDSSVRVVPDFSYYLPSSYPITVNGFPKDETSLVPVWDFSYLLHPSWSGRVKGEELSGNPLGYCAVNKAFEEELGEEAVGKTIRIKRDIHLEADDLTEDFQIDLSFVVSAVVDEFSFMGIPRVYFSYQALAGYLRNVEFLTLAGNPCSYVEEAPDDSPVSSYRSLVFASSPSSVERLANLDPLFEGFSLSSEAVAASASLSELSAAFLLLIEPFLLLVVGAGFFLLFSLAYASFLSRRREFAILSSLGARQGDLLLLTSLGPALVSFLSSLLATGLSPLLLSGGRAYFAAKAGLALLAPSLPLLAYLVLAASFFFIPLFGSLIPLLRGSFRSLHEELSEE